jgi:hypothetical protein
MHSPVDELTARSLARFPGISASEARSHAENLWRKPSTRLCSKWLLLSKKDFSSPMNPFVSEFLAQSILRRIGIHTVGHTIICTEKEARELSRDYIVKFAKPDLPFNLKWRPSEVPVGDCLASRIVPNAASLGYAARQVLKVRNGNDPSDKFYLGFEKGLTSNQIQSIRRAMDFDDTPYLRIAATRLFLGSGCTPHLGNLLITQEVELISIDHVHSYFEDGEDLRLVFSSVNRDPGLLEVLDHVAGLTGNDIYESVAEIPRHRACGSTLGLADYYCKRLNLWKELHAKSDRSFL